MTDDKSELEEIAGKLEGTGELAAEDREQLQAIINGSDSLEVPDRLMPRGSAEEEESATELESNDIRKQILNMKLPQKLKLAMFGNATCRALLIGEGNKMVQQCVLKNPQLRLGEIEDFSKNPNVSDLVLRTIAGTKEWTKSYQVKLNLVNNPKTPQDISIKWLKYLRTVDLKKLASSKNIPQNLANIARKRLAQMQKR